MLRKIISILFLVAFLQTSINAQTEKGSISIGLNVSPKVIGYIDKDNNRMELNGEIQAGYFMRRNLLAGVETSYNRFRVKSAGEIDWKTNTFRFNVFARKYFDIKETKWKPFIGLSAGYGTKNSKSTSSINEEFVANGPNFQLDAGLAYFLNKNTSIHLAAYGQMDYFGGTRDHITYGLKVGFTHNFKIKKNK